MIDTPAMRLPSPTLSTPRLVLRPFERGDATGLVALHTDTHVLRHWDAPPWRDAAPVERFLATCRRLEDDAAGTRLAMVRRDDGAFVGWCGVSDRHPSHRSAALTFILSRSAWGRGFATEAVGALLGWAFDALDLHRVQAEVDTRNAASARVLDKLGFVREGTLRENCNVDGDISNSWVHGLLRREWAGRQAAPAAPGGR